MRAGLTDGERERTVDRPQASLGTAEGTCGRVALALGRLPVDLRSPGMEGVQGEVPSTCKECRGPSKAVLGNLRATSFSQKMPSPAPALPTLNLLWCPSLARHRSPIPFHHPQSPRGNLAPPCLFQVLRVSTVSVLKKSVTLEPWGNKWPFQASVFPNYKAEFTVAPDPNYLCLTLSCLRQFLG